MRYYVQANHSISFFKNKTKAIEFATNVAKEKDIHYVAYGVDNYEGWFNCVMAVVKCEEEWIDALFSSEIQTERF